MTAKIYIVGEIGIDTTLKDVVRQFKSFDNVDRVVVTIDSVGGSVEQGESIYLYLRKLDLPITTIAKKAYSIASFVFMAGDDRFVFDIDKNLMIHMPAVTDEVKGNADYFAFVANELRDIETRFTDFYALHTDIDKDTITKLLRSETYLSGSEAITMGFATEIKPKLKAVAKLNNPKSETKMSNIQKLIKAMQDFTAPDFTALKVQDSEGVEIEFTELQKGDTPSDGDKALIDGEDAKGTYITTTGKTWKFEEGILTIKEDEDDDEPAPNDDADDLDFEAILKDFDAKLMEKVTKAIDGNNEKLKAETKAVETELSKFKKLVTSEGINIKANAKDIKNKKQSTNYLR